MTAAAPLRAPFPWHGAKSRAASLVWSALGDPAHYVEPFAGSAAVLLARVFEGERTETLNDADGFVCNFFRAVRSDPAAVAHHCDWPVSEIDLFARHRWLVAQAPDLHGRLEADPEYSDPKVAGWWVWGLCQWIGDGWRAAAAASSKLPKLDGQVGVHRATLRQIPLLAVHNGVHRRRLGRRGVGDEAVPHSTVAAWLEAIGARLRRVRIACGDWTRVLSNSALFGPLITGCRLDARDLTVGVFLDPPYAGGQIRYAKGDGADLQPAVAAWCRSVERDPRVRVVLAGEVGQYDLPGWPQVPWKRKGGGVLAGRDQHAERLWLSPQIERAAAQGELFEAATPEVPDAAE